MPRQVTCRACKGTGYLSVADYIDTPPRIVQDPGVCGGEPRIDGTRIRVRDISGLVVNRRLTVETIAELYPELTEAHIAEAIGYWQDNLPSADDIRGLLADCQVCRTTPCSCAGLHKEPEESE